MSLTYGIEMLKHLFSDIQINRDALLYTFLTFWVIDGYFVQTSKSLVYINDSFSCSVV